MRVGSLTNCSNFHWVSDASLWPVCVSHDQCQICSDGKFTFQMESVKGLQVNLNCNGHLLIRIYGFHPWNHIDQLLVSRTLWKFELYDSLTGISLPNRISESIIVILIYL